MEGKPLPFSLPSTGHSSTGVLGMKFFSCLLCLYSLISCANLGPNLQLFRSQQSYLTEDQAAEDPALSIIHGFLACWMQTGTLCWSVHTLTRRADHTVTRLRRCEFWRRDALFLWELSSCFSVSTSRVEILTSGIELYPLGNCRLYESDSLSLCTLNLFNPFFSLLIETNLKPGFLFSLVHLCLSFCQMTPRRDLNL